MSIEEELLGIRKALQDIAEILGERQPALPLTVPEQIVRQPRTRKPAKVAEAAPAPVAAQPSIGESESAAKVQEVAVAFVRRFQNETPSGQDQAREMLRINFKGKKIKELSHAERVDFIDMLEEKLNGVGDALTSI